MKLIFFSVLCFIFLGSCASKKDILYLQDASENKTTAIDYQVVTIQPNDILKITVSSLMPEASIPYNRISNSRAMVNSIELMQLEGYLVTNEGYINYPILGDIIVENLSAAEIEKKIAMLLEDGGHLSNPNVIVRSLNSKFTVLGEVKQPGTYSFTEQNITILQALGYAGDLTINGKRDDIIITRDVDGIRKIAHIDVTTTNFMNSEYYYIKPNDQIIVNQNNPRVMNSGYIGSTGTILTIASLLLSVAVLLSR